MKILSFDIESCTGNPWDGSLCSFGFVLAENGAIIKREDILVNPLPRFFSLGKFGEEANIKLAYPVSAFRSSPRFNARYSAIKALFEEADLILGFSAQNDMKYLNNACDAFSLPRFSFEYLDVQLIAGIILPEYKNLGLKAVAAHFGIEFAEHRSDEDARATYEIFVKLMEVYGGGLEELIERYGVVKGKNGADGHTNCYSLAEIKNRLAAGGRSVKKILVFYYFAHAPGRVTPRGDTLKGERVNVSENIYLNDMPFARKIIATAAAEGCLFDSSIQSCSLFIAAEGDKLVPRIKKINRRCKIITAGEFAEKYVLSDMEFDDFSILTEHYAAVVPDRETPEERAARLEKRNGNTNKKR